MEIPTKTHRFQWYSSHEVKDPALIKYWRPCCERTHQHGFVGKTEIAMRTSHCLEHSPVLGRTIEIAITNTARSNNVRVAPPTELNPTPLLDRKELHTPPFHDKIRVHEAVISKAVVKAVLNRTEPQRMKRKWSHWHQAIGGCLPSKAQGPAN